MPVPSTLSLLPSSFFSVRSSSSIFSEQVKALIMKVMIIALNPTQLFVHRFSDYQQRSFALLALCEGNPPVDVGFPSQRASYLEAYPCHHNRASQHGAYHILTIPCLLMPWRLKEPGHQQAWYWSNKPEYSVSSIGRVINLGYMVHHTLWYLMEAQISFLNINLIWIFMIFIWFEFICWLVFAWFMHVL